VVLEKSELEDKFITDEIGQGPGQGHSAELMNTSECLGTWGHAGSVLRFTHFNSNIRGNVAVLRSLVWS
jgi:hypothetical protein